MTREAQSILVRYGGAAVVFCLYAAGSALFVQVEGKKFRTDLADARSRMVANLGPKSSKTSEAIATASPVPGPEANSSRSTKQTSPEPPAPPVVVGPSDSKIKPIPDRAIVVPAVPTQPPVLDPIWDRPAMKRKWDLERLTAADERELGRMLHELIIELHPRAADGPWLERIQKAARPLLAARKHTDIEEYVFTVMDSDEVNAFSHTGGYIYLNRGLFDMFGKDEEYVLQFVIAHEIAHVDSGHALYCLKDAAKKLDLGTLPLFYAILIPRGYHFKNLDFEADRWAYNQMMKIGDGSTHKSLSFLRKFKNYAESHGFQDGFREPKPDRGSSDLDNHFRAHPAAWERLERLESPAEPVNPAALKPLK